MEICTALLSSAFLAQISKRVDGYSLGNAGVKSTYCTPLRAYDIYDQTTQSKAHGFLFFTQLFSTSEIIIKDSISKLEHSE